LQQKNELNIPECCSVLNTDINADYVFVGDEAFRLSQHVLRPYGGRNLTKYKRLFNYRLITVDITFIVVFYTIMYAKKSELIFKILCLLTDLRM